MTQNEKTTPSPIPPCPTCGRMPSERFGEDFAKCEYPGDGETYGPMVEYVPTGYVTARCPDPIHDLADRLVAEHATPRASDEPCFVCGEMTGDPASHCAYSPCASEAERIIQAATHMDWGQVVLNNGSACFHVEDDGRFCGRASPWDGHSEGRSQHFFEPLYVAITRAVKAANGASEADALREASIAAFTAGYRRGHHDTVESGYVDVRPSDEATYFAEEVDEFLRELTALAARAQEATE